MAVKPDSFAELYCERHHLEQSDFNNRLIRRSLHFRIRIVGWLLLSLRPDYFEADLEFVAHAGSLKSLRKLEGEIREFSVDYRNRGLWRGVLRQRVSTHRLRHIFRETINRAE